MIVSIADACELVTDGTHYTPKDVGQGFPFLTVKDVTDSRLDFTNCSFISEADFLAAKAGNSAPKSGDVLFSKDGTVGKVHVITTDQPFAVLSSLAILRPKRGYVSPGYLGHALRSPSVLDDALKKKTGSAIRRIVLGDLKRVRLPLPPLPEQRRIAAILDQAETLRTQRRAALAQLDSLTQSLFLDMFGDPVTNPKGWPRFKLCHLIATGPQNGLYKPSTDYGSGTPILRIDAFYDGVVTKLNSLKRVRVSSEEATLFGLACDDIVINRVNSIEYLGKSAIIPPLPEPIVFESNMMRFSVQLDRVDPGFVVQFLQTPYVKAQILSGSKNAVNQSSINQQDVKGFLINVPPLPLQQTFATRIQAIEALKTQHRAALAAQDALFASLQQRAFAGTL